MNVPKINYQKELEKLLAQIEDRRESSDSSDS